MEEIKNDIKEIKEDLKYHIKRTDSLEDYVKDMDSQHKENLQTLENHLAPFKDFLTFLKVSMKIIAASSTFLGFLWLLYQLLHGWS